MVSVEFSACLLGVLLLFVVPLNWLSAAFFAAAFHEVCHIGMILLCGGRIHGFHIGIRGAKLDVSALDTFRELICAAAGPAGSFLLLVTAAFFPRLAVCGFIQGCFNCLPFVPFDGGRILRCIWVLWIQRKRPCKQTRIGVQ